MIMIPVNQPYFFKETCLLFVVVLLATLGLEAEKNKNESLTVLGCPRKIVDGW